MFPSNIQAEQALLGAVIANSATYERVVYSLDGKHFADPIHSGIYACITRRIEAGEAADAAALKAEFEQSDALAEVGGTAYLAQLLVVADPANIDDLARRVIASWTCRSLIELGERLVRRAFENPAPADLAAALAKFQREAAALAGDLA